MRGERGDAAGLQAWLAKCLYPMCQRKVVFSGDAASAVPLRVSLSSLCINMSRPNTKWHTGPCGRSLSANE